MNARDSAAYLIKRARFVCIADVHIGNHGVLGGPTTGGINERCALILHALSTLASGFNAVPRASRYSHPTLAIAGDLFDTDKPSPAILAETMRRLEHLGTAFRRVALIPGNHDRTSDTESAFLPLRFAAGGALRIPLEDSALDDTTIYLSFQSRVHPIQHVRNALAKYANDPNIDRLVLHYGIMDDTTPPWLRNAADAIHVDELVYELQKFPQPLNVFAGNWHDHKCWAYTHDTTKRNEYTRRGVYQCGAFVSTGFDNEGSKTGCAWVELEDGSVQSLQCNTISFETVHDISELPALLTAVERDPWANEDVFTPAYRKFFRVLLDPEKAAEQRSAVNAMVSLHERDGINKVAAHVRIDFRLRDREGVSQEQAQSVARASVSGVSEALSAYIDQMPLAPGVDRAAVLAEARRLVKLEDA